MRHFTRNGTDQYQNGSSDLLTPHREQSRSTRIAVTYPRPAFSATKRKITLQLVLINKPKFLKATVGCFFLLCAYEHLKKNLNASRLSEHAPVRGKGCQNV